MGALRRMAMFGGGGLLGAAVGLAVAYLTAPQSGDELKARVNERVREVKAAGAEAEAAKHEELIRRYRAGVGDPAALKELGDRVHVERGQAATAVGLGLNAPGALAAHEIGRRLTRTSAAESPASEPRNPALDADRAGPPRRQPLPGES